MQGENSCAFFFYEGQRSSNVAAFFELQSCSIFLSRLAYYFLSQTSKLKKGEWFKEVVWKPQFLGWSLSWCALSSRLNIRGFIFCIMYYTCSSLSIPVAKWWKKNLIGNAKGVLLMLPPFHKYSLSLGGNWNFLVRLRRRHWENFWPRWDQSWWY